MKKKNIIILSILIINFFFIGSIYAHETSNETINIVQSDESISEEILTADDNNVLLDEHKTWYVEPDPENPNQVQKPTVQPIINQANPGDTIILNGTFVHCHFTINKTLTLLATPDTTLGVCPHHNHPSESDTFGIFYITPEANGTIIDGFGFTNNYFHVANVQQNPFAVLIDGASNIQLRNLSVNWTGVKVNELNPEDYKFKAIILKNANNITLTNVFLNNTLIGVNIINSTEIKLENLTIIDANESGVLIGKNSSDISINYKKYSLETMLPLNTKLLYSDLNINVGRSKDLKIQLLDFQNNILSNKQLNIFVNGLNKSVITNENGISNVDVSFTNYGVYYAFISFTGDNNYTSSFGIVKINVNKNPTSILISKKTFKVKSTKKISLTLKSNNSPIKSKKITFKVNKKTYSAKTNSKGIATIKFTITKKGKFNYKISFSGDGSYNSISKTGNLIVK